MPGARNPKTAKFSVNVTDDINARIEHLADVAGANKTTLAAMCISAGLNLLERVYLVDLQQYVEQATSDKVAQLTADVNLAGQK